jgi:rare lipoprotein A (peptidoglycan hydrolase)
VKFALVRLSGGLVTLALAVVLFTPSTTESHVTPTYAPNPGPFTTIPAPTPIPTLTPTASPAPSAARATPSPVPKSTPRPTTKPTQRPVAVTAGAWHLDANVSWYGPGFYGHRTACGLALTKTLIGVAHRTLPCGTLVEFRVGGRTVIAPVVDRGPYVAGRQWDLTGGLCLALRHCYTGSIEWRLAP